METRLGLDLFHSLIDKGTRNTMIWAPRQSGKTYALVWKFLQTPNSVMFGFNSGHTAYLKQMCDLFNVPDRRRDVHRIQQASSATHRRVLDGIFIDEIDFIPEPLIDDVLTSCYPSISPDGRLIAMSTPSRIRNDGFYGRKFQNEFTVNHDGVLDWRMEHPPLPTIFLNVIDHFRENEQECFRI